MFMDMTGDDMESIVREMDKLISYVGEKAEIYPEDVNAICTRQIVSRIFDMISAAASRKQNEALRLYYDLLANREPAMRILRLLSNQFNQLLQVKDLMQQGLGRNEIANKMEKTPYITGKISDQAARFKRSELERNVQACVYAEEEIKSGRISDTLAVELIIVECSGI